MNRDNIAPTGACRHSPSQPGKRLGSAAYLLAGIPFFAVSFGVCFANRDEPILFGFPFLLTDKAFVAKVSQGGMYEVELGKLAQSKGGTQDIKDQGNTEAHDHTLVGDKLKSIIEANGMEFPKQLSAEFQARLDKISTLPGNEIDAAYIEDMKKIHAADGAAFAKEAVSGTNPDLKQFAAETYRIVQRHLGELGAKVH